MFNTSVGLSVESCCECDCCITSNYIPEGHKNVVFIIEVIGHWCCFFFPFQCFLKDDDCFDILYSHYTHLVPSTLTLFATKYFSVRGLDAQHPLPVRISWAFLSTLEQVGHIIC